jgi:hypothetical protein
MFDVQTAAGSLLRWPASDAASPPCQALGLVLVVQVIGEHPGEERRFDEFQQTQYTQIAYISQLWAMGQFAERIANGWLDA